MTWLTNQLMTRSSFAVTAALALLALALASVLPACGAPAPAGGADVSACPGGRAQLDNAPGVRPEHRAPAHWLAQGSERELLGGADIAALNSRNRRASAGAFQDVTQAGIGDQARVSKDLSERAVWLRERLDAGKYLEARPGSMAAAWAIMERAAEVDLLHLVALEANLRCVPTLGAFRTATGDAGHDRNRCSSLHPAEVVRVLRQGPDGWLYVHAGHSVGWLHQPALSPAIDAAQVQAFRSPAKRVVVLADGVRVPGGPRLRLGTSLPLIGRGGDGSWRVSVPTQAGLAERTLPADARVTEGHLPLTRAKLIDVALGQLDTPYGWGGEGGGQDCSRYLLDLFGCFGVELGRHSAAQSHSGTRTIDVATLDDASKREAIRAAGEEGAVLLYMPGHIMLYLGESGGRSYAVSAIADYLQPCPDGEPTTVALQRVAVTDLEVGRGTKRRAFIERIVRIAVFKP